MVLKRDFRNEPSSVGMRFLIVPVVGLFAALLFFTFSANCQVSAIAQDRETSGTPKNPANFQEIIERAKQKVFPALVFIKPIVEEFETGEKKKQEVFGSGVIISPDGLVVTNNHVVEKAVKVNCVLFDKDQVPAQILGRDPDTDLALLKLDVPPKKMPLPYGEFADSDKVTEGDFVMALGSPFGFTRSISLGIVSNTQRYIGFKTQYKYNTWLQTDAAINPGNSGGPLVNIDGKIIGINTLGLFIAESVGFAIPSNVAKEIARRLKEQGKVQRAWCGIELQPLKDFFTNTFTEAERGVLISDIEENSPAQAAGIRKGDILLTVGGMQVNGTYAEDLPKIRWYMADLPTDKPVAFKVLRDGKETSVSVTLEWKGKVEGEDFDCRRWNMTVKEINKHKSPDLYFYRKEGVYVQGVRYPGNAQYVGIQKNDILLSVDRKEVATLKDIETAYKTIVADGTREKKVFLEVLRSGYKKWIVLDYTKDYEKEE